MTTQKRKKSWDKRGEGHEGPFDAIVIGSGMGGMTTAALLAKLNKRVLVLEQHYVPGGFTHMFRRKQYTWDVGVHAVGEVTEHSLTGRILSYLSDGELEWASLGSVYDEFYFPDEFRIDFPDNPQQFRQNLIDAFPEEEEAILAYLDMIREISGGMRGYYLARTTGGMTGKVADMFMARRAQRYFERPTIEVVEALTDNPKLRSILTAQWGYYGSPPSRSCVAIQALVNKHFMWGGYYPVGGSKRIAETLLKTVADAGGWTRISTDVQSILIEKGKAVGVTLADGSEIRAKHIISAAGISSTIQRLLPAEQREKTWAKKITSLQPAPAHICLYIGFKGDITQAGASAANKWFYSTWDMERSYWHIKPEGDVPTAPCLYCSFPSLKDPEHDPGEEVLHTGEIVTFVPWETFAPWRDSRWKRRDEAYDAFKKRMEEALLKQFLQHMPALEDMIEYVELSTPLSTDHFCRPVHGSIYGLEPTPERFKNPWLRAKSPIPGLYFSGSEVASVGVIGAMMGGVLAATSVAPTKMMSLLRKMG
ncbi:MAG: FAD-dependent oxidoreductase [Deltaproteobacteria bacterium]|nr:FAD-dependent oxidoreductase [Deltaproteobacteria bacterium]|tara:strand:+ start:3095 stop:4702 length:1608 start_codon:yes stop_codon:yes gene_type:complete